MGKNQDVLSNTLVLPLIFQDTDVLWRGAYYGKI